MLNMTSHYYIDQLAEKLQLMIATGDLRVASSMRNQSLVDDMYHFAMSFDLDNANWNVRVEYYSESDKLDFIKMIQLLAEKLANRALQEVNRIVDSYNKVEVPQ